MISLQKHLRKLVKTVKLCEITHDQHIVFINFCLSCFEDINIFQKLFVVFIFIFIFCCPLLPTAS